jgi:type IV secretory pathway VirB2 component (pilin)
VQIENRRRIGLLVLVFVVATSPGLAQAQQQEATWENGGLGAASAICSLVYGPVKVATAILGLVVGGLSYPLSGGDADVTMRVINTSVRGDYVVTPSHLRGERPLEFWGRAPEPGY